MRNRASVGRRDHCALPNEKARRVSRAFKAGAGEGNRTLLLSVSFRLNACRYGVFGLNRLLVSAQSGTVFSTFIRHPGVRYATGVW